MPPLNPAIGVEFHEILSGHLGEGVADPHSGAAAGSTAGATFSIDLLVRIASLKEFVLAGVHEAAIASGRVSWKGHGDRLTVEPGGTVVMYRKDPRDPRHKYFDFTFSFRDAAGDLYEFRGLKDLHDDHGFDAPSDMSEVAFQLVRDGQVMAAGLVEVHPDEILDQLESIQVTRAGGAAERAAAREEFFGFMNRELEEIYPEMPHLFCPGLRLTPPERRVLTNLATALKPENPPPGGPTVRDVVDQLDKFVANASSKQLDEMRTIIGIVAVLEPLLFGDLRQIKVLARQVLLDGQKPELKETFQMIHQLVTFPYFAHPKVDELLGYLRPVPAPGPPGGRAPVIPISNRPRLPVAGPEDLDDIRKRVWDVAIVGSGVAGSILADQLTAAGKSVLILEAGPYIPEQEITTDEVLETARLFKSGALQQANAGGGAGRRVPSFLVLQPLCVGGGGVVNNAVCFRLPPERLARWNASGFPVPQADLDRGYDQAAHDLDILTLSDSSLHPNPSGFYLEGALKAPMPASMTGSQEPGLYECAVNLERRTTEDGSTGCLGLGLCNLGCAAERKKNASQVHLPRALGRDCSLLPDAQVLEVLISYFQMGNPQRVNGLLVSCRGRTATIRAREYVLSAGAVGSSTLLLASQTLTRPLRYKIGRKFSANLGSPVYAFYDQPIHARPSTQIAHYVIPPGNPRPFVLETWFNPPGAQALALPGYFETHFNRAMKYASMVTASPLVGTGPSGIVGPTGDINLPLGAAETDALREGIGYLARALLKGGQGKSPEHVLVSLGQGREMRTEADVTRFERDLTDLSQLRVGTGHPQGGNAMGLTRDGSVVDRDYRVWDITNLRVCDASVFPDSAGVNPQWTVMALAYDCARRMVG